MSRSGSTRPLAALLACAAMAAAAQDGGPGRVSGSAELWGYGTGTDRSGDSPLNPGNQVAQLPSGQWTGEARVNLRLSTGRADLVLRPRILEQRVSGAGQELDQAYLGQAFARIRLDDSLALTAGRELLTWGPGNFRSPSHPLYFDAGRTDPLRDVPGVDLVRLTWTRGPLTLMLAREQDAGRLERSATPEHVTLAKLDLRGGDGLVSAVVADPVWGAPFCGGFAQFTCRQAWLVYAEFGSGRRPQALEAAPPAYPVPFTVQSPSPRRGTGLLGASYTLLNGQSVALEWLNDGHGLTRRGEADYFARAGAAAARILAAPEAPAAGPLRAELGQGISQAPALLGRDYASLLWQSNPQESGHYWRLMWTANARDWSSQVLAYGEKNLASRCTVFAALTRNLGGAHAEFAALVRTSLTLGVKYYAF